MTKHLINCGHSAMLWGHYLTHGKRSPEIGPNIGSYEGEFNRAVGERLFHLLPDSRLLTPGPCNVTQATRRKNINWIASLEDVVVLSIHANAAQNSGWQTKASGARIFIRSKPWKKKALNNYYQSVEIASRIDNSFRNGPLPYPVRSLKQTALIGIVKVKCPSILIECGFQDNRIDAAYMASESGRDEIAEMIADGVR